MPLAGYVVPRPLKPSERRKTGLLLCICGLLLGGRDVALTSLASGTARSSYGSATDMNGHRRAVVPGRSPAQRPLSRHSCGTDKYLGAPAAPAATGPAVPPVGLEPTLRGF